MTQQHRDVHTYMLLKARTIHTASLPGASPPFCLANRGDGQPMPQVEVREPPQPQEEEEGSQGKRRREEEREVVAAVAAYVVTELKADLVVELMELMPFREPTLEIPDPPDTP